MNKYLNIEQPELTSRVNEAPSALSPFLRHELAMKQSLLAQS